MYRDNDPARTCRKKIATCGFGGHRIQFHWMCLARKASVRRLFPSCGKDNKTLFVAANPRDQTTQETLYGIRVKVAGALLPAGFPGE